MNTLTKYAISLHRSVVIQRAADLWFLIFLVYVLIIPAGRNVVLIPLLGLTTALGFARAAARAVAGESLLDERAIVLLAAAAGAVPVAIGVIADTPGWADVAVPLVGGPIAWFGMLQGPSSWALRRILTPVAIATLVISAMVLMLLLGIGESFISAFQPRANGSTNLGLRVNLTGASTLIGTVPLLGIAAFDSTKHRIAVPHVMLIRVSFVAGFVAAVISGRQGIVGAVALAPVLLAGVAVAGFRQAPTSKAALLKVGAASIAVVALAIPIVSVIGGDPTRVVTDLTSAVILSEESENARVRRGSTTRTRQAASLLDGFRQSPLVGQGAGAVSPEFHLWRNFEIGEEFGFTPRPWRAELHYHLLLFEGGLLTAAGYAATVGVAVVVVRRRYPQFDDRDRLLVRATLVSAGAILLATAYNPIVRGVSQQLYLYLPLFVVASASVPSSTAASSKNPLAQPRALAGSQEL